MFQGILLGLTLASSTFTSGATLPPLAIYRGDDCTGGNRSPELHWSGVPVGTKGFVLTMHDPDAPVAGGWWHWVRFAIPSTARRLPVGAPGPGIDGLTSWGTSAYGGPCPPPGDRPHHYVFVLRALDIAAPRATSKTTGPELERLIAGHVLGTARLVGRYGRGK